jgi:hypothetical protein
MAELIIDNYRLPFNTKPVSAWEREECLKAEPSHCNEELCRTARANTKQTQICSTN